MGKPQRNLVYVLVGLIICSFCLSLAVARANGHEASKSRLMESYGKLPLYFIKNGGQVDEKVLFYEKGGGHATFFTKEGVYLSLVKNEERGSRTKGPKSKPTIHNSRVEAVKLTFLDSNKDPEIIAEGQQEGRVNYFVGNDPSKWRTNIPTYRAVLYKEVYKGVDIRYYGDNRQIEYDIIVKPGADPGAIMLSYDGIEGLRVTAEGDLEIRLKEGSIVQKRPRIYQEIEGRKVEVAGEFKVEESGLRAPNPELKTAFAYGFQIPSYDKEHPLAIDPVVVYSTYLGGSDDDPALGIAVDASGNAYITGYTYSINFLTASPIQGTFGGGAYDAFVTKINTSGSALVYSTYLGGSYDDYGYGIAVDTSGNAYITGYTNSTNFPTASPIQGTLGGWCNAFVTKINASGSALVYSTYLGGSYDDYGYGIAVDTSGNAYVTGTTGSPDFPTHSPIQGTIGGWYYNAFVTKINASGSALVYSTYLGGEGHDEGHGIAVDTPGNAYITGDANSANFPTASPIQGTHGGGYWDAFVTKINASGSALVYSTYLGGEGDDEGYGIAVDTSGNAYITGGTGLIVPQISKALSVDTSGNAYVTGNTESTDFPTVSPIQGASGGGWDAFVTKINASGSVLVYSTYLGGSSYDFGVAIAVDTSGNAYVTGNTESTDFPTHSPIQGTFGGGPDAFVTKINDSGSALVYSTYLGGSDEDLGLGIAVDASGNAYITGATGSTNFPTASPIQGTFGGGWYDAFVIKISSELPDLIVQDITTDPVSPSPGQTVNVTVTVKNQGIAPAGQFSAAFYQALPPGVTPNPPGDTETFGCEWGGLDAGAEASCTGTVSYSAAGTYNMWAYVDTLHEVAESNESNNVFGAQIIVVPPLPTITTTPYPPTGSLGTVINDCATLAGGLNPTGAITFKLFGPSDQTCSASPIFTQTVTVSGNGTYCTSAGYILTTPGTYHWIATYSGDANNPSLSSGCADEPVLVCSAPRVMTTPYPLSGPLGAVLNDCVTLTGGCVSPTGTITCKLYGPSDPTCSGVPVYINTIPISGDGTYCTSPGYIPMAGGTYHWVCTYSGDANNASLSSGCADEPVPIPIPCADNTQCPTDQYCGKGPGNCSGIGTCEQIPGVCTTLYDPVCGCDGKTYSNECEASRAKVSILRQGVCSAPDLIETSVSNPPATASDGGRFYVTDTVKNQGDEASGASTTRYYLSLGTTRSSGDILLMGGRSVLSLAVGKTSTGAVTVTIPPGTPAGSYYLLTCADDTNVVVEKDESNNCISSSNQVHVSAPDLIETSVSNPPATALTGSRFSVTDTTKNQGNAACGTSTTRYYLSPDGFKNGGDRPLLGRPVPDLAPGGTSTGTVAVTIPSTTPLGTYYLLACADDANAVAESDENNNCIPSATTVQVISGPDLVEMAVTNPPATASVGTGFSVTDAAKNQGNVTSGNSTARYYLSVDKLKDAGDTLLTGSRLVSALAPGATSNGTVSVTIPLATPLGTYYLLACVDDTNAVAESDETNNCIASNSTVLIGVPDLIETTVTNPPATAKVETRFWVTDTAKNQGNVTSGTSTTRYYLSLDKFRDAEDMLLTGSRSVPGLAPGGTSKGTVAVTIPSTTPLGIYYLLACADDLNALVESDETNDCVASGTAVQVTP